MVRHLEPVADLAWVKRQILKGRTMGGVNVNYDKYAVLEIASKLPFPFVHKVVVEEQRLQKDCEGAITVMMAVQGRGSGLHVAREMSVEGGDLYYSTAYIDGQKVTAQNETLVRMSTYSPMQRRMLSIASSLMHFESERKMRHFADVLKRLFSKGWKRGGMEEDGFWDRIEGFEFDPFRYCSDAASGQRKAFQGTFMSSEGRGVWVDCKYHFEKSLRDAEKNLPAEARVGHRLMVRMPLVSQNEDEWRARFDKLLDWYDLNLSGSLQGRKKMINWAVFWKYK
jgi:hypothetical protein